MWDYNEEQNPEFFTLQEISFWLFKVLSGSYMNLSKTIFQITFGVKNILI